MIKRSDVEAADQPQQERNASQQAAIAAQQASSAAETPAGAASADVPDKSNIEPPIRYFFMHILRSTQFAAQSVSTGPQLSGA